MLSWFQYQTCCLCSRGPVPDVLSLFQRSSSRHVVLVPVPDVLSLFQRSSTKHVVFVPEVQFWNARLGNLEYIYDQLRDEKVRKMAVILEKTDSAYFPCFKTLFRNIVAASFLPRETALAEAKDIVLYLKPLMKHLALLEDTDFSEVTPFLRPLLYTVCLIWSHSCYYCNSSKIIVLLRQICNLLINQNSAQSRFRGSTLSNGVQNCTCKQRRMGEWGRGRGVKNGTDRIPTSSPLFPKIEQHGAATRNYDYGQSQSNEWVLKGELFDEYKERLPEFFIGREPMPWTFHPNIVFERFQSFLDRLNTVQSFFNTVIEFMKLEKVEIGGLKGRILSSRIVAVFAEFNEHLSVFACKTYDVLNPEDEAFVQDYVEFQARIRDLDRRLASVLCQAFDDCCNLESVFKLIEIVGSVLDRPLIKDEFTGKYKYIVEMLEVELASTQRTCVVGHELNNAELSQAFYAYYPVLRVFQNLYTKQITTLEKYGWMPVDKNLPTVAGALRWAYQLRQRITIPVTSFRALQHP
uniref:Dynein heavy chain tail domain-containing protein n=1 Tax=Timema bartmani TaxID=61472 RepID=A0A7R9EU74_9NEOP|nr:unnamed protein product [Timema bartmani]